MGYPNVIKMTKQIGSKIIFEASHMEQLTGSVKGTLFDVAAKLCDDSQHKVVESELHFRSFDLEDLS